MRNIFFPHYLSGEPFYIPQTFIIYSKIKSARFSQTQIFNEKQLQHVTINIDIMGQQKFNEGIRRALRF